MFPGRHAGMGPSPPAPRLMATAGPCGVVLTRSRPAQDVRGGAERVARAPAPSFAGSVRRRRLRGNIFFPSPDGSGDGGRYPAGPLLPGVAGKGAPGPEACPCRVPVVGQDFVSHALISRPPPSECFPVGRSIGREVGTGLSWMVCPGFWGSQVPVWSSGQTDTCPRGQAGKGFPGWPAGSTSFMSLSLPCGHAPRVDQMALRALGLATLGQGWGTSVRMGVPGIPPRPVGGPRCWAWTFFAAEIGLFCHQVDADTILFSACRWRPWASGCTWGALGFRLLSKA